MPIRIGHWVRGWRLDKFFKRMFSKINEEAKQLLPVVTEVTNKVKALVGSPIADVVTAIIPGDIDDKIKEKLREKLPMIVAKLQLASAVVGIEDINEQLRAILDLLHVSPEDRKKRFFKEFAYTALEALADGKLTMDEAAHLMQMYYDYEYKEAA